MSKQKLTPWFVNGEKPVRKGVYKVRTCGGDGFAYWDGQRWGWRVPYVRLADTWRDTTGATQGTGKHWRGLAYNPKAKP